MPLPQAPQLRGTELSLKCSRGIEVPVSGNIIFNTPIYNKNQNVIYNMNTGIFTFCETGTYLINWWVAIDQTMDENATNYCNIAITVDGEEHSSVSFSTVKSFITVNGNTFVDVENVPAEVSLKNTTPTTGLFLGLGDIQGGIVISQVF